MSLTDKYTVIDHKEATDLNKAPVQIGDVVRFRRDIKHAGFFREGEWPVTHVAWNSIKGIWRARIACHALPVYVGHLELKTQTLELQIEIGKTKVYPLCVGCQREISPTLDAYYGRNSMLADYCSPCRNTMERSAKGLVDHNV